MEEPSLIVMLLTELINVILTKEYVYVLKDAPAWVNATAKKPHIISMNAAVKTMFAKLPADITASCANLLFFLICFSSGSTNAARNGPRNPNPVDLTFILLYLANIPCANSWNTAIIAIATIQYVK